MFGLRGKILVGFGGLLLIVAAISLLAESVLDRYSAAMQRSFREDYDSVALSQRMKESVERIDARVREALLHHVAGPSDTGSIERDFDDEIRAQRGIATLVGEREATEQLGALWEQYRHAYPRVLDASLSEARRRELYEGSVYPQSLAVRAATQKLIDMNMESMLSVHGKASAMAARANWVMRLLGVCGVALAVVFAFLISRLILGPVRLLTRSVHEIELGNLDLTVPVGSRDELGKLATAFNAMAAQLRDYRQRDRDRLARTEHTTQLAIDSLPDAVVVINPGGTVELTNEAAKRLFGLAPGAALDDAGTRWLAELHRGALRSGHSSALEGYESMIQLEVAGEKRFFLPRTVPIKDGRERVIGATVILADVTGLRRLDEMKNGLLWLVSHELKTPLTSLRMVLHLVTGEKMGPLGPRERELLDMAREDGERLHQIVESLLDMGRIEAGKALMDLRPVAPGRMAQEAAEPLRSAFESQATALLVDVPEGLPQVLADPARVGYVFANLLGNALRHTAAGGRVCIRARAVEEFVEFSVEDDGAGIPPQYLHRVFEKFFRVPGQAGSGGSGLGLAIVKEIVEAHGGQVRVNSSTSTGTTFAFTLRRADLSSVSPEASESGGEVVRMAVPTVTSPGQNDTVPATSSPASRGDIPGAASHTAN